MGNVIRTCRLAFVVVALWAHSTGVARTQAVTDGLVAHWPMDKIEGNAVKDASGGSDADIVDSNLATGNGQVGKAVEFDGAGYGDTGVELMEFGDGYSITAWIRTSEVGVSILSKGNGAGWGPSEKELYVADAATSEGPNTGPVEMVGWVAIGSVAAYRLTTASGITSPSPGMTAPAKATPTWTPWKERIRWITTAVRITRATSSA
jgi:hypothetical protein